MPTDANGVPFDMSHIYASAATSPPTCTPTSPRRAPGALLATRLYELTDDPGMKDMLSFLIARDTMHQQQWLAVLEELGGPAAPADPELVPAGAGEGGVQLRVHDAPARRRRGARGPLELRASIDGTGEFHTEPARPLGDEPILSAPAPEGYAQTEQLTGAPAQQSPNVGTTQPEQTGGGVMDKLKDSLS